MSAKCRLSYGLIKIFYSDYDLLKESEAEFNVANRFCSKLMSDTIKEIFQDLFPLAMAKRHRTRSLTRENESNCLTSSTCSNSDGSALLLDTEEQQLSEFGLPMCFGKNKQRKKAGNDDSTPPYYFGECAEEDATVDVEIKNKFIGDCPESSVENDQLPLPMPVNEGGNGKHPVVLFLYSFP